MKIREKEGFIWYEEQMVLLLISHGLQNEIYGFLENAADRYEIFVDKIDEFLTAKESFLLMDETGELYLMDELKEEKLYYYPVLNAVESIDGADIIDDVFLVLENIERLNNHIAEVN